MVKVTRDGETRPSFYYEETEQTISMDMQYTISGVLWDNACGLCSRCVDLLVVSRWILSIGIVLCAVCLSGAAYDRCLTLRTLIICATTLLLVMTVREFKVGKVHIFLIGYLLASIATYYTAINRAEWLYHVLHFSMLIMLLSIVRVDKDLLANIMIALGIVFIGYFWYEYFTVTNPDAMGGGLMRQRNWWATAHFFVIPFCIYKRTKLSMFIASMMLLNIIMLGSRAVLLAACVTSLLYVKKRYLIWLIIAGLSAFVVSGLIRGGGSFTLASLHDRLVIWQPTLLMIKDYPFGVGVGNWVLKIPLYSPDIDYVQGHLLRLFLHPHNDFLWVWAEAGCIGIICYLGIFATAIWQARKKTYLLVGIIGYMVISFFCETRTRPFQSLMIVLFLAMACELPRRVKYIDFAMILLVFSMVVFGFRYRASCYTRKLRSLSGRQWKERLPMTVGYSAFTPLTEMSFPWHWWRAMGSWDSGNKVNAVRQFKTAYKYNPGNVQVINGMGLASLIDGKQDDAEKYFKKALEICPDFVEPKKWLRKIR